MEKKLEEQQLEDLKYQEKIKADQLELQDRYKKEIQNERYFKKNTLI